MVGMRLIMALLFVGLLGTGCQHRFAYAGTWKGTAEVQAAPDADPVVAANLRRVELEIEPTGRYSLFLFGMPEQGELSGLGKTSELVADRQIWRRASPGEALNRTPIRVIDANTVVIEARSQEIRLVRESQPTP